MTTWLDKSREFFQDHRHRIQPTVNFVGKCVENVASLAQLQREPTAANYINVAFKCKESFEQIFKVDQHSYFLNREWEHFMSMELWQVITQLIKWHFKDKLRVIRSSTGSNAIYIVTLEPGIKVGWIGTDNNHIEGMFVSAQKTKEAQAILAGKTWAETPSQCISVDILKRGWQSNFILNEENSHNRYIACARSQHYSDHILKYVQKSLGRSILFYGPPGTGKSNLIRAISNSLKMKTIRLQKLHDIRNQAIAEVIDLFDPDAVVLEDIDHLYGYDIAALLDRIESLNYRGKYLLATANEVSKINTALLRPGRFDELIEIAGSDQELIKKLVGQDEEIFALVKEYPIAFINEVMKRVETIGKTAALASLGDIQRRIEKLNGNVEYKL
jgi:chromosomal replication initiation ATPase DnaA